MQETIERTETPPQQATTAKPRVSIYQPTQEGVIFPELPIFATHAKERQHRKERLAAACRAFALQGFDYGFAGHLTIRDPEFPELYWTNPMCVHFSNVKVSNLILVDHKGKVVEGTHAVNRAGFVLHAAVHEAYPEVILEVTAEDRKVDLVEEGFDLAIRVNPAPDDALVGRMRGLIPARAGKTAWRWT